ncbi:MAG: hypothetical protein DRO98_00350 [Archaeoglobales archaeon]|nr:MAG: hypothetical protein DRO98_00350 [Archaeoglobales archaeon]
MVEWTHSASRVLIEKKERRIPLKFSTPSLKILRYSTKLPEPEELSSRKAVGAGISKMYLDMTIFII